MDLSARRAKRKRILRRLKSFFMKPEWAYRLFLWAKFRAGRNSWVQKDKTLPNDVLASEQQWKIALNDVKRMKLPIHRGVEKNWDHLAAITALVNNLDCSSKILDAGGEFYSNVLPALFLCGFKNLVVSI